MTSATNSPLPKPSIYETKQIRLTSRILHIGSAVSRLNPFEYVQANRFVYLPDSEALAKALKQRGFLNDYVHCIEDRESIGDLLNDAFGDDWVRMTTEDGQPLFPRESPAAWTGSTIASPIYGP